MILRQIYYHLSIPIGNHLRDKVPPVTLSNTRSMKKECRGRSPLPGCGVSPQNFFTYSLRFAGEPKRPEK